MRLIEKITDSGIEPGTSGTKSCVLPNIPNMLSTKHHVLSTKHRVLSTRHGVLSTEHGVLSVRPCVLSTKPCVLSSEPSVLLLLHYCRKRKGHAECKERERERERGEQTLTILDIENMETSLSGDRKTRQVWSWQSCVHGWNIKEATNQNMLYSSPNQ